MGLGQAGIDVTVEIDLSGTAYGGTPTWTDVTQWVLTKGNGQPISIPNWGRQDRTSDCVAATCEFTLDNRDGRFTPGLSSSPYYPNVRRRARCRVRCDVTVPAGGLSFSAGPSSGTYTMSGPSGYVFDRGDGTLLMRAGGFTEGPTDGTLTYTGSDAVRTVYLFDGLIDSWDPSYTYGGMFGIVTVQATDMLGRYGTELPLRAMLYEEILKDLGSGNTGYLYPFNDQGPTLGTIKYIDSAVLPPLTAYAGSGGPDVVFQNATGCADQSVTGVGLGGFFSYINAGFAVSSGQAAFLFFTTTFTGYTAVLIGDRDDDLTIGIDVNGYVTDGTSTGPFIADGLIHLLVYIVGDGWYVDGVRYGDVAIDTVDYLGFNFVGTLWCFGSVYSPPAISRFDEWLECARTNFAGESTDAHIARLLGYRTTFGSSLDTGRGQVGVHATDSETLQQALYDTGAAEGGVVFADGQARIVMIARTQLFDTAPDLILDASAGEVEASTAFRDDTQFVVNRVKVTGPSGAEQVFEDPTSIDGADGLVEDDISLIVATDAQALAAAKWRVQVGVQEQTSSPQLDVNLFTVGDANTVLYVLQTRPLDVVRAENLPSTTPTVEDFMVQGGSLTIGAEEFLASLLTTVIPAGDPY